MPTTMLGKAFGSLLILIGIILTTLITATLAAAFVSRQEDEIVSAEQITAEQVNRLERQLERLEQKLDRLLDKKPPPERD